MEGAGGHGLAELRDGSGVEHIPDGEHDLALVGVPVGPRLDVLEPQERGHDQNRGESGRLEPVGCHHGADVR